MLQLLLIAIGLSMDAFSVSVVSGICNPDLRRWHAVRAALFFGVFQGVMPLIGWLIGSLFSAYVQGFDHWIAFALLALIGGKMAIEAIGDLVEKKKGNAESCEDGEAHGGITRLGSLLVLAVATSIDALAVGFTLNLLGTNIYLSVLFIGVVTFSLSLVGVVFGKRIGSRLGEWAEISGGLILVAIGVKILAQHILAGV